MAKPDGMEVTSYAGATTSIVASLTMTDIGIIIGIITALATFWLNRHYASKKDKREEEEHAARMKLLERGLSGD